MKRTLVVVGVFSLLTFVSACGPSPEQVATMTAAAWTATPVPTSTPVPPTPTFTPTPIPYDLTVTVTDEQGAPVAGASIFFPESGSEAPVQSDAAGQFAWKNLPGPAVSLKVSAPGYFAGEQTATLERGPGQVAVKLKGDPFGLLPSKACAPDEKLLYIEDFQDGKAQGFQNITGAVEFGAQTGWGIGPKEEGNQVVIFNGVNENLDDLQNYTFDNAVWRLKVQVVGKGQGFSFLNWRHSFDSTGDARYPLQWGDGGVNMALTRLQQGAGHFPVANTSLQMKQGEWYFLEISSFDGTVQVWVDGKKLIDYKDPKPLPAGTIALEVHNFKDPNTSYYFDDLSVCELSAPFAVSLFAPAP
jgi:hypothetical protein